jgi:FtsZ-binding cell division protein ZapB
MNESEFESIVATLDQENRQMRARMERLENENQSAQDTIARLMLEINRLHNEAV